MKHRKLFWKNISFILAVLLLWVTARFVWVRLFSGAHYTGGFAGFDVAFVFLPPIAAFFMNWHALREEATGVIIHWTVSWAAVELLLFMLVIYFAANPLHRFFLSLQHTP